MAAHKNHHKIKFLRLESLSTIHTAIFFVVERSGWNGCVSQAASHTFKFFSCVTKSIFLANGRISNRRSGCSGIRTPTYHLQVLLSFDAGTKLLLARYFTGTGTQKERDRERALQDRCESRSM